ncbi:MAG: hypothetical protein NVS2B16_27760 [Chloroflexota bacterium]
MFDVRSQTYAMATKVQAKAKGAEGTGSWYDAGHIPLRDLRARAQEILGAPHVIFVCHSGSRSTTVARAIKQAGHPVVAGQEGGMQA